MSRPLMFRAWDTVSKKFFWPWPEGFNLFGEVTCFDAMGQQLSEAGRDSILGLNDLEIDQFTGLKDMDGADIYENDILKVGQWTPGDAEDPGIWLEDANHLVKWHGEDGYPAFDLSPGWKGDCNALAEVKQGGFLSMKVIGNIHQNPELLK